MGDEMDVADDGPEEIPVATQHAFLDQAKSYNFVAVKDMVTAQPGIVNVQPAGRWSALHQAAEAGEETVVQFLLDHGADKNVKTKDGRTPLQVCKNAACRALLGGPEKRSAGYKPEGEPVAKAPAAKDLTITVNYAASGELLKTATVSSNITVEGFKAILKEGLQKGKVVQQLLKENYPLPGDKTLEACDLASGAVLNAVLDSVPVLYLSDPCSFTELAERRDGWMCGDEECLVDEEEDGKHADIADAPAAAKEVADAMKEAAPGLSEIQVCGSSESGDGGEIIVIAHPGPDPKKACLKALGIRKICDDDSIGENADEADPEMTGVWTTATLDSIDMKGKLTKGFNKDDEDEEEDEEEEEGGDKKQMLALTAVMNEKLQKHFCFNFGDEVVTAPVIYGGYASDDCIVGVLSSRVWT